jgi:surfactin synthase thioesterase subunit
MSASDWVYRPRPPARVDTRLVCLPYAGGSAQIFARWGRALPAGVDLCAVQLPGRANRHAEPAYRDVRALVPALAAGLRPWLDAPFVLLGHSMGAILAFELTRFLRRHQQPMPQWLIVSGCRAPQLPLRSRPLHDLPEAELIDELRALGGLPSALFDRPEHARLFTPLLRADLTLFESYGYTEEAPLACPILALGGLQDPRAPVEDLSGWEAQTIMCDIRHLPGGHFFLHAAEPQYLQQVRAVLA